MPLFYDIFPRTAKLKAARGSGKNTDFEHREMQASKSWYVSVMHFGSLLTSVSYSIQATITKLPQTQGLINKHLFFTVLKSWKLKIKVPANSVSGGLLPGLETTGKKVL